VKLSFVCFDEIEKASDAVWNLLLGILDRARLTLGDNRKADFSSSMVFLTSNLGAGEMSSLVNPRLGFHAAVAGRHSLQRAAQRPNFGAGIAVARRKFTPEFIKGLDSIVVFKSLGREELHRIVDVELEMVQQRIRAAAASKAFLFNVTDTAREVLLMEGTDSRYGARHLKRAIERLLVKPLSNLLASGQIHRGDCIRVIHDAGAAGLIFGRESEASVGRSRLRGIKRIGGNALPGLPWPVSIVREISLPGRIEC
jgi:ATP-dependent Clp protease ATP-binding subunit ClpB